MLAQGALQKQVVRLAGGAEISYIFAGVETGPAVVLLHGGGTDNALLSWRETIPALLAAGDPQNRGFRIYAPNYPGYGDSPLDGKPSTLAHLVETLAELMDAWKLDKAALVGISMGAGIALGYTLNHPERVSKLVLVGAYGIQDTAPYHTLSYFLVHMPRLMDWMWGLMRNSRWAARYSLGSILHNPQARTEALVEEVLAAMRNPNAQLAFGQFQRDELEWAGTKTNYTARLNEINIPVLLAHGSRDAGVPLKYAQRAAGLLPQGRLEVFAGAGHWTQRDEPERFNQLLVAFLKATAN